MLTNTLRKSRNLSFALHCTIFYLANCDPSFKVMIMTFLINIKSASVDNKMPAHKTLSCCIDEFECN